MVYEQSKKRCKSPGGWETCQHEKTVYIRAIQEKGWANKEVRSWRTGEKVTRPRTTHKMKWVRIGRFCPVCLNIDYDSDWIEENKKEYEELREY